MKMRKLITNLALLCFVPVGAKQAHNSVAFRFYYDIECPKEQMALIQEHIQIILGEEADMEGANGNAQAAMQLTKTKDNLKAYHYGELVDLHGRRLGCCPDFCSMAIPSCWDDCWCDVSRRGLGGGKAHRLLGFEGLDQDEIDDLLKDIISELMEAVAEDPGITCVKGHVPVVDVYV